MKEKNEKKTIFNQVIENIKAITISLFNKDAQVKPAITNNKFQNLFEKSLAKSMENQTKLVGNRKNNIKSNTVLKDIIQERAQTITYNGEKRMANKSQNYPTLP